MRGSVTAVSSATRVPGQPSGSAGAFAPALPKLPGVTASIGYLDSAAERPYRYMYQPPSGTAWQSGDYRPTVVRIADARAMSTPPDIHVEGFELWDAPSALARLDDEDAILTRYYAEAAELARLVSGARRAVPFDHTLRRREAGRMALGFGREGERDRPGAVGHAHVDYTEISGRTRLDSVPFDQGMRERARHFAIVNVWRSIGGKVLDTPLALCDARSVSAEDLVASDLRYPHRTGELYLVLQSPCHRWSYFSEMDRHEALVFKQYDTQINGTARFTPHCAFDLPEIPPDAPLRESLEVRCLVIYD